MGSGVCVDEGGGKRDILGLSKLPNVFLPNFNFCFKANFASKIGIDVVVSTSSDSISLESSV